MATFKAGDNLGIDLLEFDIQDLGDVGEPTVFTSTTYKLEDTLNLSFNEFHGTAFTYNADKDLIGGTLNEIIMSDPATIGEILRISSFSMPVTTALKFLDANNSQGFLTAVFAGNDTMSGSPLDDQLLGYAGNDTIDGALGNDTLIGAAGNDSLIGGLGDDSMDGGAGNDSYVVDSSTDKAEETGKGAAGGTDTVISSAAAYTLGGNIENLTLSGAADLDGTGNLLANIITGNDGKNELSGDAGNDKLLGGKGDDSLSGGADNDTLDGGDGNDSLDGGTGKDSMAGGKGDDVYFVDDAGDKVVETLLASKDGGSDLVHSSVTFTLGANVDDLMLIDGSGNLGGTGNADGNDITGNDGANKLSGLAGNDSLFGGAGKDTLDGGTGNDSLDGGEGDDLLIQDSAGDQVGDSGTTLGDELRSNQLLANATAGIEHYTFTGTKAVTFTGDGAANKISGTTAGDTLKGGSANDSLHGLGGVDQLYGDEGDDLLDGGSGGDSMAGGIGNDTYVVDSSMDRIDDAEGTDDIVRASVTVNLQTQFPSIEHVVLTGAGALNATGSDDIGNKLTGNDGANKLDGRTGNDSMAGGKGNDTYTAGDAGDVATENAGEGTDLVQSSVSFKLGDNLENLTLTGGADIDGTGNSQNNVITGNDGANLLDGGGGNDSMAGGKGNDSYIVGQAGDKVAESVPGAIGGVDLVIASVAFTLGANVENLLLTDGAGNLAGTGNADKNLITGNDGDNRLSGVGGDDSLDGKDGNDTLDGGIGNDSMTGGKGDDVYLLDSINDEFSEAGGDGSDTVAATFKIDLNDTKYDGIENATLLGTAIEAIGDAGANTLSGNASGNKLSGNDDNDSLAGAGGNDTLDGGDGDDSLDGGVGSDSMQGGKGSDVFFVDSAADKLGDSGDPTDKDEVRSSITYSLASLGFIENALLLGVAALNLTGNALGNVLTGNEGNNKLDGAAGDDTLHGNGGNDTLTGTAGGADDLLGGKGNDVYVPDTDDSISEAVDEGIDLVQAAFTYSIAPWANVENLTLTGTAAIDGTGNDGKNVITGNANANKLDGGAGTDTLVGGTGDDSYVVDDSGDKITEAAGGGTDTVFSSAAKFSLSDNVEHLTLTGIGDIEGTGNALANKLTGNSGNNILSGLANNDTMNGGAGADTLNGGLGTDTYLYDVTKNGIDKVNTGDNGLDRVTLAGDDLFDWITKRDGNDLLIAAIVDEADAESELDPANAIRIVNQYAGAGIAYFTGDFGEESNLFYGADKNLTTVFTPTGLNGKDQGANAEVIEGTDGNDTINGNGGQTDFLSGNKGADAINSQSDVNEFGFLYGGEGNDTLTGSKGRDNLRGDEGDDLLIGGDGNDRADYRGADEGVTVDLNMQGSAQTISAGQGNDTLISVEYVRGGQFNDTLTGDKQDNTLNGRDGDDVLTGNGGSDFLLGGKGNDTLDGGSLDDFDEASFEDADEGVIVNLTNSTQAGVAAHSAKDGQGGIDSLIAIAGVFGSEFGDQFFGADNPEFFEPMGGNDTIDGAGGFDEVDYFSSSDGVTADLTKQGQLQLISASQGSDLFTNIEGLDGGAFNDSLTGDANDNFLSGRAGADSLQGGAGADDLRPGPGNDTVDGGIDTDFDRVNYFQAISGVRVDLSKQGLAQVISASEGSDTLFNIDDVLGSQFNDTLIGNFGENLLAGIAGNDSLSGGDGFDLLAGGAGNDTLNGGSGFDLADYINAVSGVRVDLTKLGVAQIISADEGSDVLITIEDVRGSRFDDTLIGNGNDNLLIGLEGNDRLSVVGNLFFVADGGDDIDRLVINGANFAITQQDVLNKIFAIEEIDLTGTGNNSLALNALDVLQTSDTGTMRILGNVGDTVTSLGQGWVQGSNQVIDGQTYATYNSNLPGSPVTLLVDTDITRFIS